MEPLGMPQPAGYLLVFVLTWSLPAVHPLPDINDQSFIDEYIKAHNYYRSQVKPVASDMKRMSWDEALAKTARAWARKCNFNHNNYLEEKGKVHPVFSPVGENIWVGRPPQSFNASKAIQSFYSEVTAYSYQANSCTSVCGHYTQLVWAKSYKVGCAVVVCEKGIIDYNTAPGAIFVCDYAEAGNYRGVKPYKTGEPCTGCDSQDSCSDHLCSNSKRDQQSKYPHWTPDWDDSSSSANTIISYQAVLITRLLSLIPILAMGYAATFLWPQIFAYE
ncbi:GLIPR1-like protein 1 [Polypterus senegalus]|uniref:GLIPR1-like protein 1 n=1 Tax=Polypterus senegalus TaxID=55291 RepID=UPI001962DEC6|nr:GLIPR1-like protein 1 [Polypterus senegalus]